MTVQRTVSARAPMRVFSTSPKGAVADNHPNSAAANPESATSAGRLATEIPLAPPDPLKVLYVLGSLRDAGTERQALELVRHLDHGRFLPSLLLMEDANPERSRALVERGVVERCDVLGIPQGGNSHWMARGTALAAAVARAARVMRRGSGDIVHAFLPGPSIVGGIAARLAGIPLILGSRRSLPSQYRAGRGIAGWADTGAFYLAHFNLGNSRAVAEEMVALAGCPAERCGVIHNGVDLRRFHPKARSTLREEADWTHGEVVFGQVANFRRGKRLEDFVAMADLVARRHPEARFVLAGADYGIKAAIVRQIETLGLDNRGLGDKVKLLPGGPSPEAVFAALDIYVCTSEAEGFSNSILEAMACGRPVIATNVGGNPEVVRQGETGFLVLAGDVAAMAKCADLLLFDAGLRQSMGWAGRLRAEREFSLAAMVASYEELYGRLFADRKGGR